MGDYRLAGLGVDRQVWRGQDMREAMYQRDVAIMFRLLQRHGWSQRQIATATGQSEISEILAGRKVTSYEVLLRLTEGFAIPRGWLGLAYADITPIGLVDPLDDPVHRRALLTRLAATAGNP